LPPPVECLLALNCTDLAASLKGSKLVDDGGLAKAIEAHCRLLSDGNKKDWLALWSDDAVIEDPIGAPPYVGKASLATAFWDFIQNLSPMSLRLDRAVIVRGNEGVAIIFGTLTVDGKLAPIGPIVDHFLFDENDKIIRMRAFWN